MASVKAEKPVGTQAPAGQVKKEPAKAGTTAPKAPASKTAPKKAAEPKPQPKKRSSGGKSSAAKN